MTDETNKNADAHESIAAMIEAGADDLSFPVAAPAPPSGEGEKIETLASAMGDDPPNEWDGSTDRTPGDVPEIDKPTLEYCAMLDHSDTDNGQRLRSYFGNDLLVLQQDGAAGGDYLAWTGTHWDIGGGAALASKLAQRVGEIIKAEVDFIAASEDEPAILDASERARKDLKAALAELPAKEKDWTDAQRGNVETIEAQIEAGKAVRAAIAQRKRDRRRHAVTSKNAAKIDAMLRCAAPHLRTAPAAFNPNALMLATQTHTITFRKVPDLECPDPDAKRMKWEAHAVEGHSRADMITALLPVRYDPEATGEKWNAFLDRFLPLTPCISTTATKRRTVQQFCGAGLLGVVLQYLMFHYGLGANGKSVFLETLMRVLGSSFAVSLPPETLVGGGDRNAGGAAPDIMRLFGKRMLRVPELPVGKPLQEDLVKRITGGEEITARTLFKGYVDFQNVAKPHMSGNGFPKIEGNDNGIWRRMLVVHWDQTIAEIDQRPFEQIVRELASERSAILNWLIAGACDFLDNGLVIAPEIKAATQEYRDEMDSVGMFIRDCVEEAPGQTVQARAMYDAYLSWCKANAKREVFETKFGTVMKSKFKRDDTKRVRVYLDVRLHDVPTVSNEPPHAADEEV